MSPLLYRIYINLIQTCITSLVVSKSKNEDDLRFSVAGEFSLEVELQVVSQSALKKIER